MPEIDSMQRPAPTVALPGLRVAGARRRLVVVPAQPTLADRLRRRLPAGRHLLIAGVLAYLGLVLLLPLGALLFQAASAGLPQIARALAEPDALFALRQSLVLVAVALVVNGALGVAGAVVLVRHRFLGRRFFDALVDLPLALSPVMVGLAFLLLFGSSGWLRPVIDLFGFKVAFAFPGLVLCTLLVTLPFTVREVGYVLEEIGTTDEEAAATLGASPWQTFWRVTLPNIRHGLSFGLTLTVARALGEFGAVLVLGGAISGRTQTATTYIYAAMEERQAAGAYGMALLMAAASLLLLLALERFKHRKER